MDDDPRLEENASAPAPPVGISGHPQGSEAADNNEMGWYPKIGMSFSF